jgi:hypothetical protein
MKRRALTGVSIVGAVVIILAWCVLSYFGAWPPDIGAEREFVLATASSPNGEHFKLFQVWNGEPYATKLEQSSSDGMRRSHVIECDARKLWKGTLRVVEAEKKLIIVLGDGSPPIEYRYDSFTFVLPPGRQRVRD